MRSISIAIHNAELSLGGASYLAQFAIRILGKLLSSRSGILGGFLYHLGFDCIQACKFVNNGIAPVFL